MRGRLLRAALLALLLALPCPQSRAGSATITVIGLPGTSPCPGGAAPGALGAAIDRLGDELPGAFACRGVGACAQAAHGLGQAFDAVCAEQTSRALSSSARAIEQLEHTSVLSTPGTGLDILVSNVAEAAQELVGGARDELDADVAHLCASARAQQGRALGRIDQGLERADLALANGPVSAALQELGRALQGIESAQGSIASAAARCWPRACRGENDTGFRHGAAQNASLELVPVDRGAVALYRVTVDSTSGTADVSGTLRLVRQGSSRTHATGQLRMSVAPGPVLVDGDLSTQACLDANGWVSYSNVSERFLFDNEIRGRGQLSSSLRLVPGAAGLPPVSLLPAVPQALALRVGDEVSASSFGRGGTIGGVRGGDRCSATHRVTAVEELRVEAGGFEAARIDSSVHCGTGPQIDWTAWVASEIGFARFEMRSPASFVSFELACFASADTPDACPPEPLVPLGRSGGGAQGIDLRSLDAKLLFPLPSVEPAPLPAQRAPGPAAPTPGTASGRASGGLVVYSETDEVAELQRVIRGKLPVLP